jgi:hypothetical protein
MQPVNQSERTQLCKINVPDYLYSLICTTMVSAVDVSEEATDMDEEASRTELDSHANMPVVGRNAYIISDTGKIADVNPFTPDYAFMRISIVDATVRYDCLYDGKSYIFVVRNALHVPSMRNNLIPPFVMREAGIRVNDTPKIQTSDPNEEDHFIYFPDNDFRNPLSLWGVFSYFNMSKPLTEQMMDAEDVYLLTPSTMNPHSDAYATNEENMLDSEGNMVQRKNRVQILLSDIPEDAAVTASVEISSAEARTIDNVIGGTNVASHDENAAHPCWQPIPRAADEVSSILASVSPRLDDQVLYGRLAARADLGKFKASIGSTDMSGGEYLAKDDSATETSSDDNVIESNSDDEDELR